MTVEPGGGSVPEITLKSVKSNFLSDGLASASPTAKSSLPAMAKMATAVSGGVTILVCWGLASATPLRHMTAPATAIAATELSSRARSELRRPRDAFARFDFRAGASVYVRRLLPLLFVDFTTPSQPGIKHRTILRGRTRPINY